MILDGDLLSGYAGAASEEAFAELVRRHLDLVYSAARRQVNGDAHLAQGTRRPFPTTRSS